MGFPEARDVPKVYFVHTTIQRAMGASEDA